MLHTAVVDPAIWQPGFDGRPAKPVMETVESVPCRSGSQGPSRSVFPVNENENENRR